MVDFDQQGGQRQSILTQFEGPEFNLNASSSYIADSGLGPAVVSVTTAGGHERLYGYKFFAQVTAVCPEPLQEIALAPQESASWEQRLVFSLHGPSSAISSFFTGVGDPGGENQECLTLTSKHPKRGVDLLAPDVISSAKEKQGYYCLKLDIPDGQRMI
eukprot:s1285_g24.t1